MQFNGAPADARAVEHNMLNTIEAENAESDPIIPVLSQFSTDHYDIRFLDACDGFVCQSWPSNLSKADFINRDRVWTVIFPFRCYICRSRYLLPLMIGDDSCPHVNRQQPLFACKLTSIYLNYRSPPVLHWWNFFTVKLTHQ